MYILFANYNFKTVGLSKELKQQLVDVTECMDFDIEHYVDLRKVVLSAYR